MNLKAPMTTENQVDILIKHGLIVDDKLYAEEILSKVNYYRFTGYALQYRLDTNKSDYIPEIKFDNIYTIYKFDEEIRNVIRNYIEKTEIYYRTLISYYFSLAKCTVEPFNQHYDENNFYNKKGYNEVMDSFKKEKNYYKDSLIVKHHKLKYDSKMPLWVIVELMSFSNISKLYSSMYISEKELIAKQAGISYSTLENHLHCLAVLRNKCAHAARLYNTEFYPPTKFTKQFLKNNPEIKNNSLFAYLLVLLKRLPDELTKQSLINDICLILNKYENEIDLAMIGFPENYDEILFNGIG